MNRYFYTTDFKGHYPVGVSAIVIAKTKRTARRRLTKAILKAGIDPNDFTVHELTDGALILQNGDY